MAEEESTENPSIPPATEERRLTEDDSGDAFKMGDELRGQRGAYEASPATPNNIFGYDAAGELQERADEWYRQSEDYLRFQRDIDQAMNVMRQAGVADLPEMSNPPTQEQYDQFRDRYSQFVRADDERRKEFDATIEAARNHMDDSGVLAPRRDINNQQNYEAFQDTYREFLKSPEAKSPDAKGVAPVEFPKQFMGPRGLSPDPDALPDSIPSPPKLADLEALRDDVRHDPIAPRVERSGGDSVSGTERTVGEVMREGSGNPFIEVLKSGGGREAIEGAHRKLAEKTFDIAWKEQNGDREPDPEFKERFIAKFMKSHEHQIATLAGDKTSPDLRARKLADLAAVYENPDVLAERLKGGLLNDRRQPDGKEFLGNPESAANDLSMALVLNVAVVRDQTGNAVVTKGGTLNESRNAGGAAVGDVIASKTPMDGDKREAIIAKRSDVPTRSPDRSPEGRLNEAAAALVQAEFINATGQPMTQSEMGITDPTRTPSGRNVSIEGNKKARDALGTTVAGAHYEKYEGLRERKYGTLKDVPLSASDSQLAAESEKFAQGRLAFASSNLLGESQNSLAESIGVSPTEVELKNRPVTGEGYAASQKRIEQAKENYALAKAVNADPSLGAIARLAVENASVDADRVEVAKAAVREAEKLTPEKRQEKIRALADSNRDGAISKNEAKEAVMTAFDRNQDGKLDEKEARVADNALADDKSPLAAALKNSGIDLAGLRDAMKGKIAGGQEVAVGQQNGRIVEDSTPPLVAAANKPPPQKSPDSPVLARSART